MDDLCFPALLGLAVFLAFVVVLVVVNLGDRITIRLQNKRRDAMIQKMWDQNGETL